MSDVPEAPLEVFVFVALQLRFRGNAFALAKSQDKTHYVPMRPGRAGTVPDCQQSDPHVPRSPSLPPVFFRRSSDPQSDGEPVSFRVANVW